MDIGAIFILLALLILITMYLAQPYLEREATTVSEAETALSALYAERDRTIHALKELALDNELEKISAEEYTRQRTLLLQEGADALRRIDAYREKLAASQNKNALPKPDLDAPLNAEDELESLIAARRRQRKAKSGGFCPNCGHPVLSSDKFCTNCGKATETAQK